MLRNRSISSHKQKTFTKIGKLKRMMMMKKKVSLKNTEFFPQVERKEADRSKSALRNLIKGRNCKSYFLSVLRAFLGGRKHSQRRRNYQKHKHKIEKVSSFYSKIYNIKSKKPSKKA